MSCFLQAGKGGERDRARKREVGSESGLRQSKAKRVVVVVVVVIRRAGLARSSSNHRSAPTPTKPPLPTTVQKLGESWVGESRAYGVTYLTKRFVGHGWMCGVRDDIISSHDSEDANK